MSASHPRRSAERILDIHRWPDGARRLTIIDSKGECMACLVTPGQPSPVATLPDCPLVVDIAETIATGLEAFPLSNAASPEARAAEEAKTWEAIIAAAIAVHNDAEKGQKGDDANSRGKPDA